MYLDLDGGIQVKAHCVYRILFTSISWKCVIFNNPWLMFAGKALVGMSEVEAAIQEMFQAPHIQVGDIKSMLVWIWKFWNLSSSFKEHLRTSASPYFKSACGWLLDCEYLMYKKIRLIVHDLNLFHWILVLLFLLHVWCRFWVCFM